MDHMHKNRQAIALFALAVMVMPVVANQLTAAVVSDERTALFRGAAVDVESFRSISDRARRYEATTQRRNRMAYTDAVERCRDERRSDPAADCMPDINDPSTFLEDTKRPAAPTNAGQAATIKVEELVPKAPQELTSRDRSLLRAMQRVGRCSSRVADYLYDLCRQTLGESSGRAAAPTGFINDNVYLHSRYRSGRATLRDRLRQVDESVSGSLGRRTGDPIPGRPTRNLNRYGVPVNQ